ncbi:MAG: hypothetical protein LC795_13700 [Acidobacteria bacterium]|nr:hypothetical protein [Acidobacteriota bacterium]
MKHRKVSASPAVKLLLFASCLALALGAGAFGSGYTQSQEKRKIKVRTFTRMPLEVKEIRNLQKEGNWLRDLEIEVKNISRQPIYFILLSIYFPDVPAPTPTPHPETGYVPEAVTGFSAMYGPIRMTNVSQLAGPDDVPLKPRETYVLKVPEAQAVGFEYMNRTMNLPPEAWNRIEVGFSFISLGDGTGYVGGRRELGSKKKE